MAQEAPDRIALDGRVARALEIARRRSGRTQEEMVRALSPYQSRPAKHPQRWHDWITRPVSVSSLALVAAARMANISIDELLTQAGDVQPPPATQASANWEELVEGFDGRLAQIAEVVGRLQETVETQGDLLDRVAEVVLGTRFRSQQGDEGVSEPTRHRRATP